MLRPPWLRIPGCLVIVSDDTIVIIWVVKIFLVQFFCKYWQLLFNILLLLGPYQFCHYWAHLSMKWFLGISNFLDEISSLLHFVAFLYFFALLAPEGFLLSPCYSLEWCIQILIAFLFSSLLFTAICKGSSDSHFAFLHLCFFGMVLIPVPVQCHEPLSIDHRALYQI